MKNIIGIYKIQSLKKLKCCYIGSAVNIGMRWNRHLFDLRNNKHPNKKLQNHYNKYGESDLQFSILLGCEKEELIKNEQFFIDSYKPWFNICSIAGNRLGCKASEETKAKIKEHNGRKGKPGFWKEKHRSEETREKMRNKIPWNKGKKGLYVTSEETKQKIRESSKKRLPISEKTRHKLSLSKMGNQNGIMTKFKKLT